MKLLSLDPSSTICGYAIFNDRVLAEMGRITPDKRGESALGRVRSIRRQLLDLLLEQYPEAIVVEGMIERQYTRKDYATALPLCGWAMGVIYGTCLTYAGNLPVDKPRCNVAVVGNQQWTRGKPKKERQTVTAFQFPSYDPSQDSGGDIADAIEIGLWWLAAMDRQDRILLTS
jgi:Holliday junction resolvasome RuvABC endonuclease subunit